MRNVQLLMDLYPSLLQAGLLTPNDTRRLAQAFHVHTRNTYSDSKRSELFPFIQQVAVDLRSGTLPAQPTAFVHLFGIYKDCGRFNEGYELWQWLVEQDDSFVSQAAYGAAIELMAYGKILNLPALEDLYTNGLKRFPGTFAEYHLAPDAIVPDRAQPTLIAGIPMTLLQGILTARILAQDHKRAYLALDTALRLFPIQTPSRYFELFMTQRPLPEAYTAFMLACRSGISLTPYHVTALITKMRAAMSACSSMADRMIFVRAIANALYAYLQTGAQLESIHVGAFIRAFEDLLPVKNAGEDFVAEEAEIRDAIAVAAHESVAQLIQAGLPVQLHPFQALISLAGKLRVPSLLETVLHDVKTAGIQLGPVGLRNVITSAGLLGNKLLIEQYWERVVGTAEAERAQIAFGDWVTFVKACRRADHAGYFQKQLSQLQHAITSSIEQQMVDQINQQEHMSTPPESFQYMPFDALMAQVDKLKSQIKDMETVVMSGQPLDLRKSPFYMHLDPDYPPLFSSDNLRLVYDEMTTDPHQPPPPPPAKGVQSRTGLPLDELRFLNWVTILEMMVDAEIHKKSLSDAVETAVRTKKPLDRAYNNLELPKPLSWFPDTPEVLRAVVQSLRSLKPGALSMDQQIEKFKKIYSKSDPVLD